MTLYNLRNPAVKRLMKEAEELLHPTEEYHAQPLEDNLFEWHFTLKGPPNTDYEGGIYHGRITLPTDYPMKPPSIILLTPNGRFETNKKICLSISGHHPESWQPSWSIRTALLAIIGFMPTHGNGAIGSLDYTPEERQQLALKSQKWQCSECGAIKDIFSKKSSHEGCLKENAPSTEPVQSSESNETTDVLSSENQATDVLSSDSNGNSSSETSSNQHFCKEKETTLVHRHVSSVTQEINVETDMNIQAKQAIAKTKNNFFFSICICLIVSLILFLCFRRLLSL